ncbi:MAG: hypothetical protein K2X27_12380 [Candidatus Obscuribacterales bacterium]|nr:hypothetical protein [Candidatus Obscuribacterales bacterium]
MISKCSKAFCLTTLLSILNTALPCLAQSTVLTGRVEHAGAVVQTRPAAVPVYSGRAVAAPPTVIYERPVYRTVYVRDNRSFWQRHPKVKAATIGAGVGAGAGALTGLIAHRSIVRGAAIGAGAGAGVGLVRSSSTLKRHPIVRDVGTGTLVGLGIGAAAGRHGGTLKGAGIGAAVGLGVGLLKHGLN